MINNCLFYDRDLNKTIPCILIPNQVYTIDHRKYVNITFDTTKFNEFNTNIEELIRYSKFTIKLVDLYPNTNEEELIYAQKCIPNNIFDIKTFENDELLRFKKLIEMCLNTTNPIIPDTFYKLADFLSYEIMLLYLKPNERKFMFTIATYPLNMNNVINIINSNEGIDIIIPYLLTCLNLFTSYNYTDNHYYIQNIMNLANTGLTFPLVINVPLLQKNLLFLKENDYLS